MESYGMKEVDKFLEKYSNPNMRDCLYVDPVRFNNFVEHIYDFLQLQFRTKQLKEIMTWEEHLVYVVKLMKQDMEDK
jgi:hypothetical protein